MSDGAARVGEGPEPRAQAVDVARHGDVGSQRVACRDGAVETAHGAHGSNGPASARLAVGCRRAGREEGVQLGEAVGDDPGAGAGAEAPGREGLLEIVEAAPQPARAELEKSYVAAAARFARVFRARIAVIAGAAGRRRRGGHRGRGAGGRRGCGRRGGRRGRRDGGRGGGRGGGRSRGRGRRGGGGRRGGAGGRAGRRRGGRRGRRRSGRGGGRRGRGGRDRGRCGRRDGGGRRRRGRGRRGRGRGRGRARRR